MPGREADLVLLLEFDRQADAGALVVQHEAGRHLIHPILFADRLPARVRDLRYVAPLLLIELSRELDLRLSAKTDDQGRAALEQPRNHALVRQFRLSPRQHLCLLGAAQALVRGVVEILTAAVAGPLVTQGIHDDHRLARPAAPGEREEHAGLLTDRLAERVTHSSSPPPSGAVTSRRSSHCVSA